MSLPAFSFQSPFPQFPLTHHYRSLQSHCSICPQSSPKAKARFSVFCYSSSLGLVSGTKIILSPVSQGLGQALCPGGKNQVPLISGLFSCLPAPLFEKQESPCEPHSSWLGPYQLLPMCPHPVICPPSREPLIVHLWPPCLPTTCLPGHVASTCGQSPGQLALPSCWISRLLSPSPKGCLFPGSGPPPLYLAPSPDISHRAFDFLSGCHCFLFALMIHTQWDLWKGLEKQNSPGRDPSDFLIQLKTCTASNSLTSSVASSLGTLPWLVPELLPFGLSLGLQDLQVPCLWPAALDLRFLAFSRFSSPLAPVAQMAPCTTSFLTPAESVLRAATHIWLGFLISGKVENKLNYFASIVQNFISATYRYFRFLNASHTIKLSLRFPWAPVHLMDAWFFDFTFMIFFFSKTAQNRHEVFWWE